MKGASSGFGKAVGAAAGTGAMAAAGAAGYGWWHYMASPAATVTWHIIERIGNLFGL